jgi:hypothetical protein
MTGDYTSQHTDLRLPSSGSRKPDWRLRAAPTPRELTAALARLKQRCPEGLPAEIEALLENREIAFVQVAMAPRWRGARRLLEQRDAALFRAVHGYLQTGRRRR